jgi:Aldo/keto reductase family.
MVKEILLGDNPFLGVSHLAQEKARVERSEASDPEAKARVLKAGLEGGVTGYTFSTHQVNLELLEYMSRHYPEVLAKLNYYILTPYAQRYVRRANIYGTVGLAKSVLRDIVLKYPLDFVTSILTLNVIRLASLFIGMEAKPYLKILPRERVKAILLHEVLTELIIAYDLAELLLELKRYVEKKLRKGFGLETRNVGQLEKYLEERGIWVEYVMTPMNPLGYQMAPSKKEAEEAIRELGKQGVKIIAINILASGAVTLEETCKYLELFKDKLYAVAYGTAKPHRAKENASIIKQYLLTS